MAKNTTLVVFAVGELEKKIAPPRQMSNDGPLADQVSAGRYALNAHFHMVRQVGFLPYMRIPVR